MIVYILGSKCDGSPYDSSCCSKSNPCGINEGDCDDDHDCSGSLVCRNENDGIVDLVSICLNQKAHIIGKAVSGDIC